MLWLFRWLLLSQFLLSHLFFNNFSYFRLFFTDFRSFFCLQFPQFLYHTLFGHWVNFHIHSKLTVMTWTIYMRDIGQITFKTQLANLAVKHLSFFIFLVVINFPNVLISIYSLLSANQSAFISSCAYKSIILLLFSIWLLLFHKSEFLASEIINFSDNSFCYFFSAIISLHF